MPSKYRSVKTTVKGITFDSKKEAYYYLALLQKQERGEIANLLLQRKFDILVNNIKICSYIADFTYTSALGEHVVDVKSEVTKKLPVYRLKKKLMEAIYGIKIEEV